MNSQSFNPFRLSGPVLHLGIIALTDAMTKSDNNPDQLPMAKRLTIHGSRIPEALASRPIGCALFAAYTIMHAP